MKLYISPSKQPNNKYVVGNTNEQQQMEALSRELVNQLREYDIDVKLATLTLGIGSTGRPLEAKRWGADFYLSVHSNAGGQGKANGAEAHYNTAYEASKQFAINYVTRMQEVNPRKSTRWAQPAIYPANTKFSEVREPGKYKIPAVLVETDYHDNEIEALWIIENKKVIASAMCQAIADTWNVKKRSGLTFPNLCKTVNENTQKPYRVKVIVDALNIRTGAGLYHSVAGTIEDKGVYTIIDEKDGWGKLKSGAGWIRISSSYVKRLDAVIEGE